MAAPRHSAPLRALVSLALLAGAPGCSEPYERPRVLTDEPVVIGISVSVVADGPYASDLASLPADRPRAEVLPLDTVELDALIADADGPRDLADAAWVLCGGLGTTCLASIALHGERYGALEPCTPTSAATSLACDAGRGARPQVVLPDFVPDSVGFVVPTFVGAFQRVAVITGSPGGPTTEACMQQLLFGPTVDLRGCAIGVTELSYGPPWALNPLLELLGWAGLEEYTLPELILQVLPPNAAPRVEEVLVGRSDGTAREVPDEQLERRSIDEPIEVEAGTVAVVEPVIPLRDQQLVVVPAGEDSWVGGPETYDFDLWGDAPFSSSVGADFIRWNEQFHVHVPEDEGPLRIYVLVTDSRDAVSWFVLELEVVAR